MTMQAPRLWPVALFTAAYLGIAIQAAVTGGNIEFVLYIVVMLILIGFVWLVHRSVVLSRATLWALTFWGLAHMAGGLVLVPENWPIDAGSRVLYSWWIVPERLKFDHVVHAYGFGITTWVCWQAICAAIQRLGVEARPTLGLMVLSVAAGMGFGAMNELVEFAATLLVPETNVGGYLNTGWDLAANLFGTTVAALLIGLHGRMRASEAPPRTSS